VLERGQTLVLAVQLPRHFLRHPEDRGVSHEVREDEVRDPRLADVGEIPRPPDPLPDRFPLPRRQGRVEQIDPCRKARRKG
jgi:hypothetical protein